MTRRARRSLVTIYWRDIPAQVNAIAAGEKHPIVMKRRFQRTIDKAAIAAGITTASGYVAEWRRVAEPLGADESPAERARQRADELDAAFDEERLRRLADNGGRDPDRATPTTTGGIL